MQEPNMFDAPTPEVQQAEIIVLITSDQKAMVMNELKKLFAFHAKRMSDEERGMFASELCTKNIPYKAILAGIRELQVSRDASIGKNIVTYWAIEEACQKHAAETFKPVECENCRGSGSVPMIRKDGEFKGAECSFACLCENGDRMARAQKLPRWNGLANQPMIDRRGGRPDHVMFVHDDYRKPRLVL